jgi:hypothetical protein
MREFSKISPAVWNSRRFLAASDDGKLMLLYLMSCSHQSLAGACKMPPAYAAHDLKWKLERSITALSELAVAELIALDSDAETVFVRGWFRFNPPSNASHEKGIRRELLRLPSDAVREVAVGELEAHLASRTPAATVQAATPRPTSWEHFKVKRA